MLRAATDGGEVWLKAPGPGTAFEVPLYELLAEVVPDRVLAPLGVDRERGWVLLPDGGEPLGEHLKVDDLAAALAAYGQLQRDLAPHAGRMLELGLADMRPQAMPARFDEAVEAVGGHAQVEDMRETYASGASAWPPRRSRRASTTTTSIPGTSSTAPASTTGATPWSPTPSPACSVGWASRPSPLSRCPASGTHTWRASPSTAPRRPGRRAGAGVPGGQGRAGADLAPGGRGHGRRARGRASRGARLPARDESYLGRV